MPQARHRRWTPSTSPACAARASSTTWRGACKMLAAFCRPASRILGRRKPDAVLGMGGYVTVPGGLMARCAACRMVLVNADAALLLSNKTLAPLAERVLLRLPGRLRRRGQQGASSPATRCAGRSRTWPRPQQRFAGRNGPLKRAGGGRQPGRASAQRHRAAAGARADAGRTQRPRGPPDGQEANIDACAPPTPKLGVQAEVVPLHRRHGRAPMPRPTW